MEGRALPGLFAYRSIRLSYFNNSISLIPTSKNDGPEVLFNHLTLGKIFCNFKKDPPLIVVASDTNGALLLTQGSSQLFLSNCIQLLFSYKFIFGFPFFSKCLIECPKKYNPT